MNPTSYILSKTDRVSIQQEYSQPNSKFKMFTDAGTEVEVSELLYSLVRVMKPMLVLETGTHIGISSTYMALALKENQEGTITTLEVIPELRNQATRLWADVGVISQVESRLESSLSFDVAGLSIDILFLDSEPLYRFDELARFFPAVRPGGLIIIHDLHQDFGHTTLTVNGQYDWPYGDFRPKVGDLFKNHELQVFCMPTPRGLTIMQKVLPTSNAVKYMKGML